MLSICGALLIVCTAALQHLPWTLDMQYFIRTWADILLITFFSLTVAVTIQCPSYTEQIFIRSVPESQDDSKGHMPGLAHGGALRGPKRRETSISLIGRASQNASKTLSLAHRMWYPRQL